MSLRLNVNYMELWTRYLHVPSEHFAGSVRTQLFVALRPTTQPELVTETRRNRSLASCAAGTPSRTLDFAVLTCDKLTLYTEGSWRRVSLADTVGCACECAQSFGEGL
jgi:hypothetical protein